MIILHILQTNIIVFIVSCTLLSLNDQVNEVLRTQAYCLSVRYN